MASALYRASARETTKRLDTILRSSLDSHFSESGIATICAYREEDRFFKENRDWVDIENRVLVDRHNQWRWLGLRLDFLGTLLILAVSMLTIGTRFTVSPAQTGVTLRVRLDGQVRLNDVLSAVSILWATDIRLVSTRSHLVYAVVANFDHRKASYPSLFDRAAAWYGDRMYLAARKRFTDAAATLQPVFTYFFTGFVPRRFAQARWLLFGPVPAPGVELEFANTMLDFYINFVNDLNPGPSWPQYNSDTRQVFQLQGHILPLRTSFTDLFNTTELLDE
ncbi:hypothetical protein DFH94DRAFT_688543 [Russula ochroleuca]|uniref:Carboxylesterase type B domain-containing protein n=1 Tax=Russula ochroleuca TaxID=152965 RepID=A0A9P5N510_9AGAM|nr:hypothetical protein DFH94DRAFT_688543 [Russula ochroleuca]